MTIYVSENAKRNGTGSKHAPFQTISQAAEIAIAGDEIIVAPGVYREWVNPKKGGIDKGKRITYRSEVIGGAVITGAEPVKNWAKHDYDVWVARIPNGLFGEYNPYTDFVKGDWCFPVKRVHTGEVYFNGKAMYEAQSLDMVLSPVIDKSSWDPDYTVYKWYTEQEDGCTLIYANFQGADPNNEDVEINVRKYCFHPNKTGINYITLSGFRVKQAATQWAPPTAYQEGMIGPHWSKGWIIEDCIISDSRCSGISLGKYLQPNNENKWTTKFYKDGTQNERDAICQAQYEGWNKENVGSHIVRRCEIFDCGQTAIVGHLGCVFSIIEDNHISRINYKQDLFGAEIAGIKMHAPIDVIFRRNHIHHCARGLWLDWQAQGTRITQNFFHDNVPPIGAEISHAFNIGEDLFIEVSHGPTLVDYNVFLSDCAARLSTQGIAFVHNLIAGSLTYVGVGTDNGAQNIPSPRYTPYHMHHRTEIAGFMTILHGDARFYNNVFVQKPIRDDFKAIAESSTNRGAMGGENEPNLESGTKPYDGFPTADEYFSKFMPDPNNMRSFFDSTKFYERLPVYTGGNVFFNKAKPCEKEKDFFEDKENQVNVSLVVKDGRYMLETNLIEHLARTKSMLLRTISTETLGEAFEPEQKFENPDGTPIVFNKDYFGRHRNINPRAGPFDNADVNIMPLAEY